MMSFSGLVRICHSTNKLFVGHSFFSNEVEQCVFLPFSLE